MVVDFVTALADARLVAHPFRMDSQHVVAPARRICYLVSILCLAVSSGCLCTHQHDRWPLPAFAEPLSRYCGEDVGPVHPLAGGFSGFSSPRDIGNGNLSPPLFETYYAHAWELERVGSADCVDYYFQAAASSWPWVERALDAGQDDPHTRRAVFIYESSLGKLVENGQRYGRLDPSQGLVVHSAAGSQTVPTGYAGFPWNPDDFGRLVLVGDYSASRITNYYHQFGAGIPLVVFTSDRPSRGFMRQQQAFAATVLLHPVADSTNGEIRWVLEFYDPLRISEAQVSGDLRSIPLAADITAPIAYRLVYRDESPLQRFLQPGSSQSQSRLLMIEPYQAGKIPLIFVHGLLSDPLTWADLGNEMRARPNLLECYQLWVFEYPTGQPFFGSAADFREQLRTTLRTIDPARQDPALDRIVLVGHSMGGLVSKLQVTYSQSTLWDAGASRPIDEIRVDDRTRHQLARSFFFDPVSSIQRVIFIGTPHQGSTWARKPVGRLGAALVRPPSDEVFELRAMIRENPGVFSPEVRRRIPTSIDLLEPSSQLLQATTKLPFSPDVQLHSIIGTGHPMLCGGPADGVVPVSSARLPGVTSEKFVHARHEYLHRHPETVQEMIRILRIHAPF